MNNQTIRRVFFQCILTIILMVSGLHVMAQAPTATTEAATGVGSTGATVNGTVNANGLSTTVTFEYGLTVEYGSTLPAAQSPVGGSTDTAVTAGLSLLDPSTEYHFRVVAVNAADTTYGADMTFTTTASSGTPPIAITDAASGIGADFATLNGTIFDFSIETVVTFEWGMDTAYGNTVTADQSPVNSGAWESVTATLTSLSDNTTFHYRAVASNVNGTMYGSDMTFAIGSGGTAPTSVTNAATGVTSSGATLNGTVNANGDVTAVSFEYGETVAYGTTVLAVPSPVSGSTATAVSYTAPSLLPNTTYHYRVTGTNTQGTTDGSDMTFTTLPLPPTVTTDAATSVTTSGAVLNGTVNANGGSTTVTFEYGTDTGYGTTVPAAQSPVTGSADTAVSRSISGLTNGLTYHYRVAAVNAGGTTYGADMTFVAGASAPTAVTDAAGSVGSTTATLNGTVNANSASTAVTFEYGEDTGYGRTVTADQSPVDGTADTAVSFPAAALDSGTTYHYRVVAANANGTVYGADMTFTTIGVPIVTTNTATPVSTSGATLNGTVNASDQSTAVTFEYGLDDSYGTTEPAVQSPVTGSTDTAVSAAITGLTSDTTYHYRVVGVNAGGTSYGADMTFYTGATAAPTAVTDTATALLQTGATLNGTVNANNDSTTVTFEYGLDTGYGSTVPAVPGSLYSAVDTGVSAVITGLTLGVEYHYRVVAQNGSGTTYGADMTFTTTTAPAVITGTAADVGYTTAMLNGSVNANGDNNTRIGFIFGTTVAYGSSWLVVSDTVNGTEYVPVTASPTGLTPNTTYHYRFYATNSITETTYGDDMTFTTLPADPVPTAATAAASGVGSTTATLNGTVNANSSTTAASFEFGEDTNYGRTAFADQSPVTGGTDTAVSVDVSDLVPSSTVHFRVVAQNAGNTVYGVDMTLNTNGAAPTAVTGTADGISAGGATLHGTVNANNDTATVTFEYGLTTAYGSTIPAVESPFGGVETTAVSGAVTGLTVNTTYHYRVVATNSTGTTNGADMTFYTGAGLPTVSTGAATAITSTTATLNGTVNANSDSTAVTFEYGETTAYGRTAAPAQSPVTGASDTAVSVALLGLDTNTTYHYRVVGVNGVGTANGTDMTFTTNAGGTPVVTTTAVTNITGTSASSGGNVTDEGSAAVTARGVCWSTSPSPTTAGSSTSNGTGTGAFTSTLGGLSADTTYYVRAYAVNIFGTGYGNELQFTTGALGIPTVVTAPVTDITADSAVSGGEISNKGGSPITAKGVCWSTSPTPTTADNTTSDGNHSSAFTSAITGLSPATTYYVRAYAVNAGATGYGEAIQFTTDSSVIDVSITEPGDGDVVSGTITIAADASVSSVPALEEGLYIARVEFYVDDALLATDTASPYETQWDSTTAAEGDHTIRAVAYDQHETSSQDDISVTVSNIPAEIVLNRSGLNFGSADGIVTGAQTVLIDNNGGGTLNWTATTDAEWLACTPGSGTGPGAVSVSVDPAGLAAGTYSANVTVTDVNATNSPVTLPVNLTVYSPGATSAPFGSFDSPGDDAVVMSSIPVTGWALDDIEVTDVKIYRAAVSGEGGGMVYIGDAVFVDGARPDVEAAYPTYPLNYRAGWGYMLLTYGLPNLGNGTFTLYAVASDAEGNTTTLGSKTITCDNANAVKPFGAIDTPVQGGVISGTSFVNYGWVLTPQPNSIPTDGSTIFVWVDGVRLGSPVYNAYRADIEALFPGYANSGGAGGHFYLDTTGFANGVHTISWTASDSGGNADGIGSRYFSILNTGPSRKGYSGRMVSGETGDRPGFPIEPTELTGGTGDLVVSVLERVMVRISDRDPVRRGYVEVNGRLNPLPVGSTLDTAGGIFYWEPGPGFAGAFPLVFVIEGSDGKFYRKRLTITVK